MVLVLGEDSTRLMVAQSCTKHRRSRRRQRIWCFPEVATLEGGRCVVGRRNISVASDFGVLGVDRGLRAKRSTEGASMVAVFETDDPSRRRVATADLNDEEVLTGREALTVLWMAKIQL